MGPLPQILVGFFMLFVYGLMFWIVWKFYHMLSRINENIAGIRQVMERNPERPPGA